MHHCGPDVSRKSTRASVERRRAATGIALALWLLAGSATAQPVKVYRLGHLSSLSAAGGEPIFDALRLGLQDLGWVEGRNIVLEHRWAAGDYPRLPALAKEIVALNPDLIISTGGPPAARAAKAATSTIPIVFVSGSAVSEGIVAGLARPGGNLTGIDILAEALDAKRLQLLKEALPKVIRVAVLYDPDTPEGRVQRSLLEGAAGGLGVKLRFVEVRSPADLDGAFATMARERQEALLVSASPMLTDWGRMIDLAARANLPAVYFARTFTENGGLMSYGADFMAVYRRAAIYVDKILRGARPGDLPVEQPTRFELVVNLKTAKRLGITIPASVLARADQVIE